MQRRPAHYLYEQIIEGDVKRDQMTQHERKLIVKYLRIEMDYTINRIAEFLRISDRTVKRYCKELREFGGRTYAFYDTEKIARRMLGRAEELQERCRARGDDNLEWKIERDKMILMGRMGLIRFKFEPPPQNQVNQQFNQQNNYYLGADGSRPFKDLSDAQLRAIAAG